MFTQFFLVGLQQSVYPVPMLIEMHAHSKEHSRCSSVPAAELVKQVLAKGLQGIVLTDHHHLWDEDELLAVRRAAAVPDHFLILTGQEVTTCGHGDILVYGADTSLERGVSLDEIRERFPAAALVWAHPYRHGKQPNDAALLRPALDGVEIFSSNHTVLENSRALRDWHRLRFTAIGGTDTHGPGYAGLYPTQFDHPAETVSELALEIRQGRCRPFLKEIPRSGANSRVTEVTIGTKGLDENRERIIIKTLTNRQKWTSADRAFHIMEAISRHGFERGPYRVPLPIDQDHESMTLIEQGVRGKTLFDKLLTASREDGRMYVCMAARWLARLHSCRLRITSDGEFAAREAVRLKKYLERFTSIAHPHARRAEEIMSAVNAEEIRRYGGSAVTLVQGHGDFHPKNVLIGQDSQDNRRTLFVAAIDFESSLCLPPAFDVGCFLAQFRNQLFPHGEILRDIPEEEFLDAYREASKGLDDDFPIQVELFRARTNLSIAAYLIKLGLGDSENLWRVLVEAEQALCMV
jgi:aminoglycoside phosphotransferase (APT) family kinase protein/predicted metal-dependent phosphoesterase TrpH